jgi:hypothetical protein
VPWRFFEPKRGEVTGDWRRLHMEELHAVYFSANIVRVIKLRRIRWAGNVARMGESVFGEGRPEERRLL